jgi:hypothetical protein
MVTLTTLWILAAVILLLIVYEVKRAADTRRLFGPQKRSVRLELIELEPRLAPAVLTWTGGGTDNNWQNPQNWDGVNVVPGVLDTAIFNATSSKDATLPAGLYISLVTLQINAGYQGTIHLNGGALEAVTEFDFTDPTGTIDGTPVAPGGAMGVVSVAQAPGNNAHFLFTGGNLNKVQLYVGRGNAPPANATLDWSGGTATDSNLSFLSDSKVRATGGAGITLTGDNLFNAGTFYNSTLITFNGGTGLNTGEFDMDGGMFSAVPRVAIAQFVNAGLFQTVTPAPGTSGTSSISITFNNQATVEAQSGTGLIL